MTQMQDWFAERRLGLHDKYPSDVKESFGQYFDLLTPVPSSMHAIHIPILKQFMLTPNNVSKMWIDPEAMRGYRRGIEWLYRTIDFSKRKLLFKHNKSAPNSILFFFKFN